MLTTSKLAGFFAAHAIWGVSEGGSLTPLLAYTAKNDKRGVDQIVDKDIEAMVAFGRKQLALNLMGFKGAVLIYDGRIVLPQGKLDTILLEMRTYASPKSEATIAIPYTPKTAGTFLVHRPKILAWKNCDSFDLKAVLQSIFEGVHEHEMGSKIWNESLDESK
jgi:hypothetical protein